MKQSFNHKPCFLVQVMCVACTVLLLAVAVPALAQQEAKFMLKDFQSARVYLKNRPVTQALMNYDMANDKMFFKQGAETMELLNVGDVDSIVWNKDHDFIHYNAMFLQRIHLAHGTVFIHWRIREVKAGAKGAMGITTQNSVGNVDLSMFSNDIARQEHAVADVYREKNENAYFVYANKKLNKVTSKKHLQKLFPSHAAEIEAFADEHKSRMSSVGSALELIDYCLSLK